MRSQHLAVGSLGVLRQSGDHHLAAHLLIYLCSRLLVCIGNAILDEYAAQIAIWHLKQCMKPSTLNHHVCSHGRLENKWHVLLSWLCRFSNEFQTDLMRCPQFPTLFPYLSQRCFRILFTSFMMLPCMEHSEAYCKCAVVKEISTTEQHFAKQCRSDVQPEQIANSRLI